jgi:diguanylate cyclase (GGDEF)-like protein
MAAVDERVGTGSSALVVDDEPAVVTALRMILGEQGFEVEAAASVAEAHRAIEARAFDLAILDKNLPDGSGIEIARAIASSPSDTKVIVLTGYANLPSAVEALKVGVADYISKPFDLDDLVARVSHVMGLLDLERANHALTEELQSKNAFLEKLATKDPLTRLSNHAHFQECLQRELVRAARTGRGLSLMLFDIDNFKEINDAHGHPVGDAILKRVAAILLGAARKSDQSFRLREADIPARYGGDEFAVILPDTPEVGAAVLAERLRACLGSREVVGTELPAMRISVGLASFPEDAKDRAEILRCADVAMYAAKRSGRNRTVAYSVGLERVAGLTAREAADREIAMIRALDECIEEDRFRFVYQPIVDAEAWRPFAYEALMRPQHDALEGPLEVVHAAERAGRVHALGRVLRRNAAAALSELPEEALLFINLNPIDIHDEELLELEPFFAGRTDRIVLEITETTAIRDYERARERVKILQQLGFKVAIDDFGAGYSGLNSLARLEPDFAKLDMGLVRGIGEDTRLGRLVKHLLEFCAGEGMKVVAEGVETQRELDAVLALGCPLVQGFFVGRPADGFGDVRPRRD